MALGPRLDLRQSQSLVMTPQLQQAIKLLALSNLEVEAFIAEEIEKNPLLEAGGTEAAEPEDRPGDPDDFDGDGFDGEGRDGEDFEAGPTADRLIETGDAQADAPLDADYDTETFHHDSPTDAARGPESGLGLEGAGGDPGEGRDLDDYAAAALSLHDHLVAQAGELLSGADMLIAARIIDLIDEAGYFGGETIELAHALDVPLYDVERVLGIIQTLDPSGVGARSLAECIALQAREADRYDPAMAKLIDNLDQIGRAHV
jgi:RNA polymerase sigma-54 factor